LAVTKALVGVFVAIAFAAPAYADWYPVGTSANNSTWYMDPDRIRAVSGKIQAWVKVDSRRDRTVQWSETKQLMSFDCAAQTERTLSVIRYDTYGKIVSSANAPDNAWGIGYDPVVPDSMGEAIEKVACHATASNQSN
jgi:hypothetical protein